MKGVTAKRTGRGFARLKLRLNHAVDRQIAELIERETRQTHGDATSKVQRNFSGTSLQVQVIGSGLLQSEFGTRHQLARPWVRQMQIRLTPSLRTLLAGAMTLKR